MKQIKPKEKKDKKISARKHNKYSVGTNIET